MGFFYLAFKFIFVMMARLTYVFNILMLVFFAASTYAANGKPSVIEKIELKKNTGKTSQKLIPEKLLKIKQAGELKIIERAFQEQASPGSNNKQPNAADTFESLIAPFIKVVAPHFYDQIIKRDQKAITVPS